MVAALKKQYWAVSGHNMDYYRSGSGEPVLLVQGITTYSFLWRNIIPLLSEEYDVIAVDLLGCGERRISCSWQSPMSSCLVRAEKFSTIH